MAIGCQNPAEVGAHTRAYRGRKTFIVGLCRSCNHPSNDEFFLIDERSWWAPPHYVDGCGVLYDLQPGDVVTRSSTSAERLVLRRLLEGPVGGTVTWLADTARGERRVTLHGERVRRQ